MFSLSEMEMLERAQSYAHCAALLFCETGLHHEAPKNTVKLSGNRHLCAANLVA